MTKKRKDILLDENFNMQANGRDILIGESDDQHVSFLLVSPKNSFKEFPTVGAGLELWRKKSFSSVNSMRREIKVQLKNDGYKVVDFELNETGETILNYENDY
jgi:hypothetical protein